MIGLLLRFAFWLSVIFDYGIARRGGASDTLKKPEITGHSRTVTQFSVYSRSSDTLRDPQKTSALRAFVTGSGRLRHTAFLLLLFRVLGKGSESTEICRGYARSHPHHRSTILVLLWTIFHIRLTFVFAAESE